MCPDLTGSVLLGIGKSEKVGHEGTIMDIKVEIPLIGAIYHIPDLNTQIGYEKDSYDILWEVVETNTKQYERGRFETVCTLKAIWGEDDETDDPDFEYVESNLDLHEVYDI